MIAGSRSRTASAVCSITSAGTVVGELVEQRLVDEAGGRGRAEHHAGPQLRGRLEVERERVLRRRDLGQRAVEQGHEVDLGEDVARQQRP